VDHGRAHRLCTFRGAAKDVGAMQVTPLPSQVAWMVAAT